MLLTQDIMSSNIDADPGPFVHNVYGSTNKSGLLLFLRDQAQWLSYECDSLIAPSGNIYNQDGFYFDTIQGTYGVDSVIQIKLKLLSTFEYIQDTVCDQYILNNGQVITSSGSYNLDTFINQNGCDSIIALELEILPKSTFEDHWICPDGSFQYSGQNYFTDTIITKDSLIKVTEFEFGGVTEIPCNWL